MHDTMLSTVRIFRFAVWELVVVFNLPKLESGLSDCEGHSPMRSIARDMTRSHSNVNNNGTGCCELSSARILTLYRAPGPSFL